ncbi:hypothetical protein CCH79_00011993 [Gambusia affinis]|uniref:Uncharacterized protein n=1 Tax=Gambusia affinis TaxID=33528 RepID=A0A315W9C6_GAMAF|nr:hypothetical protein CCH79_00011993 [Gambusia affinis]
MEQWQDAASQQLRLLTSRLNELLTKGLEWLRSEFGVDVGLKPEFIPPWIILLAACSGLLLMVALWASVCRTIFRKRPAASPVDDEVEGKRGASKPVKTEEPKKKKKKAEKKAQPNGRAVAEAQEGAIACEERVPHHQPPPPQVKTDKVAETKKSKRKAKPAVKETKAATGDGKEPEEGTWETKVSNKEKREQRKKDKSSSDGSASPGGGDTPVNAPPEQPGAPAAPPAPPASQKKKKGESAKAKAEKAEAAVSQANSSVVPEAAAATADVAVKVAPQSAAPKTSSWTTQRQTASLWRAGSDGASSVPAFFSEDDSQSNDSSDSDSSSSQSDDVDQETFLLDEPLERTTSASHANTAAQAPRSMQWAVRNTPSQRTSGSGPSASSTPAASSTGLIYIDPTNLRRSSAISSSAAAAAAALEASNTSSYLTSASSLARAYSIVIRQISDLMSLIPKYNHLVYSQYPAAVKLSYQDAVNLQNYVEEKLIPTWNWMVSIMDSTEAQLRYGSALSSAGDPGHPSHPLHASQHSARRERMTAREEASLRTLEGRRRAATLLTARQGMMSARGDFLNYALSLMRSHNDEHSDVLPVLDVCSLKHVAYVFQALIYWIKAMNQQTTLDTPQMERKRNREILELGLDNEDSEHENDEDTNQSSTLQDKDEDSVPAETGQNHPFFRRSDSMTFLGCIPPNPFDIPLAEAIPLADQPHLLQPNARKEDLFGRPSQGLYASSYMTTKGLAETSMDRNCLEILPTKMSYTANLKNVMSMESGQRSTGNQTLGEQEMETSKAGPSPRDLAAQLKSSLLAEIGLTESDGPPLPSFRRAATIPFKDGS